MLLAGVPFAAEMAFRGYALALPYLFATFGDIPALFSFVSLVAPLTRLLLLAALHPYVQRAHSGFIRLVYGLLFVVAVVESAIVAYQLAPAFRVSACYVTAALLLGGCLYVWRLRPDLRRLVWAAAFAAGLVHLAVTALDMPIPLIWYGNPIHSEPVKFFIGELLTMLLALWFARRASRISLAHAFFIAALAFSLPLSVCSRRSRSKVPPKHRCASSRPRRSTERGRRSPSAQPLPPSGCSANSTDGAWRSASARRRRSSEHGRRLGSAEPSSRRREASRGLPRTRRSRSASS